MVFVNDLIDFFDHFVDDFKGIFLVIFENGFFVVELARKKLDFLPKFRFEFSLVVRNGCLGLNFKDHLSVGDGEEETFFEMEKTGVGSHELINMIL